jgi:RNA polymerase sigma-70 factor (ECF subfamily)
LCIYLRFRGATWEEAVEIAHDAYLRLYISWHLVKAPRAWTRKVAANLLTDLRRRPTTQLLPVPDGEPAALKARHSQPVYDDGEAERVVKLLQELPPRQRDVMALTIDGYAPKEIAEILGTTANAASANLGHARRKLRELIGEADPEGLS